MEDSVNKDHPDATFFLRNSIGVIVVAMVNATSESQSEISNSKDTCPAAYNISSDPETTSGEYDWTASQQGIILGAYFWGFLISRMFVSRIAEKFGQRQSIFLSMTIAGFLAILSPFISSFSPYALAAARFVTGLLFGPFPALFTSLLSAWAPRSELSVMSTTSFAGATLGAMIGLFASGWLTENFGWRIVFYLGGSLIIIVAPVWMIITRNSPFDHPWLSNYERELLMENINIRTKKTVPWFKMAISPYVAICVYAVFSRSWIDIMVNSEGPSYFRNKIGLDLNKASYVVGLSNLSSVIFMLIFGTLSDLIVNKKYLSKKNTRKVFHVIATGGPVLILLSLAIFAKCNLNASIVLWILLGGLASASNVTYAISVIDIAPNYTASVHSFLAVGNIGSALAPTVIAALLNQGNGWNKSFYLIAGINFVSLVLYVLFMTAEPQPWNFEEEKPPDSDSAIYETNL